jgi:5-methyltetrahydrofolate--homocysteine methyltransferase
VLGGAALTRRYVEEDLKPLYHGQLFYARDAFAGLHTMDQLVEAIDDSVKQQESTAGLAADATDDPEDLIGEEAKLGIKKIARQRKGSGDTTHTVLRIACG